MMDRPGASDNILELTDLTKRFGGLVAVDSVSLEIARALATRPHLLLLDEPAAGFTPQEKVELMRLVDKILAEGITVFLIEHDMKVVMGISRNIAVLDHGELIALGPPETIRRDQRVIEAYLGKGA